jgi:protocatechuate 3,4-dioxygenase beta subunit
MSGRPTKKGCTTSSTATVMTLKRVGTCSLARTGGSGSARFVPARTRSRLTARSAGYSLLRSGRPSAPAHIHFRVQAAGYETLTTHVFAAGDPFLDSDPVFGVKDSLIASFSGTDGADEVVYDFVLVAKRD